MITNLFVLNDKLSNCYISELVMKYFDNEINSNRDIKKFFQINLRNQRGLHLNFQCKKKMNDLKFLSNYLVSIIPYWWARQDLEPGTNTL